MVSGVVFSGFDMQLFWLFPTLGEGRYLGTSKGARPVTLSYLHQIAGAIDELGFA
jgi:alkanesulfonate monooxygenase